MPLAKKKPNLSALLADIEKKNITKVGPIKIGKLILPILFLMPLSSSYCAEYLFNKIENVKGMDKQFKLTNSMTSKRYVKAHAVLDCQSFFQKFDVKKGKETLHDNVITIAECEYLYKNITSCLKKKTMKCVDTDNLFSENCDCD